MKKIFLFLLLDLILLTTVQAQSRRTVYKKFTEYGIAYNAQLPKRVPQTSRAFVMNFDGSNPEKVFSDTESSWVGAVAKNKLFVVSNRDTCGSCYFLYSCNYKGDSIKKISTLQLEGPAISSRDRGQEILVVGRIGREIRHQLFIVDVSTGAFRQLTKDTGAIFSNPCFSPDGRRIAYTCKRNKADADSEDLFVMNENGTGNRQLTWSSGKNLKTKILGTAPGSVKWQPKENFISFVATADGKPSLFAVSTDGRKQWKLTDNLYAEGSHDWSSDGKWLVLTSTDSKDTQSHITLMHWKNKDQRQLTESKLDSQQSPLFFEK